MTVVVEAMVTGSKESHTVLVWFLHKESQLIYEIRTLFA